MFKAGKKYKYALSNHPHTCLAVLPSGNPVMQQDGLSDEFISRGVDLDRWKEYVEKKRGTMFVNIYENPHHTWVHINKHNADTACPHHGMPRIACIEVPWEEGQGL